MVKEIENNRNVDNKVVSGILLYVYGEPKTAEQIAKNMNMMGVKTQYYLDYMVNSGYLVGYDDKIVDGIKNKLYMIADSIRENLISIDSESQLVIQAKRMGMLMEKTVVAMRKDKINNTRVTVAMLDDERAKVLIQKFNELHKLMDQLEEKSLKATPEEELKQYMFVGAIGECE